MNSTSKFAKYFFKSIKEDVGVSGALGDGPSMHMRNVSDEGGGKQYSNTPGDARIAKPLGKKKKEVEKRKLPESEEDAEDRCKRKADSVYGKKTSAYKSGAIVRCRKGKIWKKK
tara:strand:- start:183 stop:524 length:342 start_codon:yes stop_codon:yes gene_type:complete